MIGGTKPDIVSVIQGAGLELKRRGRDFWGRCPFHEERTPSFSVSPDRQRFKCFGCGEGGDVIAFTMKHNSVAFKDALTILGIRKGRKPQPDSAAEARRERIRAFEAWKRARYEALRLESIDLHQLRISVQRKPIRDKRLAWVFAEMMGRLAAIDHELDVLLAGDKNGIFQYFAECQGNRL